MPSGIVIQAAAYGVKQAMDTLQALIETNGGTIYARIDQQAELKKAGIIIRPLEFILFGNPAQGGPLMQENPEERYGLPAGGHPALDLSKLTGHVIQDSAHQ